MLGASATAILHSLGILALMSVLFSMLQQGRIDGAPGHGRSLVIGLAFGAAASVAMLDPLVLAPGLIFDTRAAPALLSGIYGGPVAALATAVLGSATRWWIGGEGAPIGVVTLAFHCLAGIAAGALLRRRGTRPGPLWLAIYAATATVAAFPLFVAVGGWRAGATIVSSAWWVLLSCNVAGVLILGTLLEQDCRRRRLERELRDSEARTRTAADAKTRFLASMSHEIRTPLNAVVGFVDLLRDSSLDGFQRRCTEQIRDAAHGLLRIIDDLLDYARIENGRVALDLKSTDVPALIESCRELLMPQIEAKGIACTLDLPDGIPAVEIDSVRLRQVLLNLMGNAVKFTDAGRVALIARYVPAAAGTGELSIAVADTGIGMTPQERDRLFHPFAQGDHLGRGGTGLGLVISRMLVRAMGGEMDLASGPGVGTTVTIRLPVTESVAVAVDAMPAPAAAPAGFGLRVLVVEDVALNAEMLRATLEQSGHQVQVVSDGLQAVSAVGAAAYDIVLMDVQMPGMDGLEATRAIRRLEGPAARVPIVALTAYASREDLKACLDSGMNDFLTKPLERPKLQQVLTRWGGSAAPAADATVPAGPEAEPSGVPASGPPASEDGLDRVGELLARLSAAGREDREALREAAAGLATAARSVGLAGLADRARRLMSASDRANADALGALIEDVADAGRRSLDAARRGEGR